MVIAYEWDSGLLNFKLGNTNWISFLERFISCEHFKHEK